MPNTIYNKVYCTSTFPKVRAAVTSTQKPTSVAQMPWNPWYAWYKLNRYMSFSVMAASNSTDILYAPFSYFRHIILFLDEVHKMFFMPFRIQPHRLYFYFISCIRFTISMAVQAASYPLFPAFVPARSMACSILSVVTTPKITGISVFSPTAATPLLTSAHT